MLEDGLQGLADTPPGPALAALLEPLDPDSLSPQQAVPVLRAWSRQRAHDHARMAATMARVAALSRDATTAGLGGTPLGDWAGAEIAAALTWSDGKAARELEFAETLAGLPLVGAAFDEGRIDHGKAWVFTDVLGPAELTPQQTQVLCATYLPTAPGLTAGQLRHRLVRAILAIDPDAAARRYRRAVAARAVVGYLGADGTATITASGLPADQAAAACARVDALAERLRRAGHPGTITQIRADVFLRLLDGRLTGLTTDEIITTLLADTTATAGSGAGHEPATDGRTSDGDAASDCDPTDNSDPAPADEPAPTDDPDDTAPADDTAPTDERAPSGNPAAGEDPPTHDGGEEQAGGATAELAGVEIRVGLATLLGLDRRPGEVPGWGPVLPATARDLVTRHRHAPWRFAILDDDGHLLLAGITRRRPTLADPTTADPAAAHPATARPTAPSAPAPRTDGGVVELHITASLLTALASALIHDEHHAWSDVITDLARQLADRRRLIDALDAHPDSRHARGPLLRHLQVRDRTCIYPGCRRPARACHADHTREYAHGGPTTAANTGPLCPRHHALKHHGGWRLDQPRPGWFHWTSPLGQTYTTRGEPIMPALPDPQPAEPESEPPGRAPEIGRTRESERPTFDRRRPRPSPTEDEPPPRRSIWRHPPPEGPDDPAPF